MNVETGYSRTYSSTRHVRDGSPKETSNQGSKTAVYTLASSTPRAKKPIQFSQPKIMSPIATNYSQRRKHVASLSVIPKDKISKIVVLPSIDKDIPTSSRPRPISGKIPVAAERPATKVVRQATKSSSEQPQTRYISCLHTSLSTEWKEKDSFEEEDLKQNNKVRRTSSLQIDLKYKITEDKARPTNKCLTPDKNISRPEKLQSEENTKGNSNPQKCIDFQAQSCTDMDKQRVRIQYLPLRRSFTIKERVADGSTLGTARIKFTANGLSPTRLQDTTTPRIRPRMLPKSRFRVKIQKVNHKSINIPDSSNSSQRRREKGLAKEEKSVIIQDKSVLRSFSVQKPTLLSTRY